MKKIMNSELVVVNPYKSEVFSVAMIFLEMSIGWVPQCNEKFEIIWNEYVIFKELKNGLNSLKRYSKKDIDDFVKTIKECLTNDQNKRPDFFHLWMNQKKNKKHKK